MGQTGSGLRLIFMILVWSSTILLVTGFPNRIAAPNFDQVSPDATGTGSLDLEGDNSSGNELETRFPIVDEEPRGEPIAAGLSDAEQVHDR